MASYANISIRTPFKGYNMLKFLLQKKNNECYILMFNLKLRAEKTLHVLNMLM